MKLIGVETGRVSLLVDLVDLGRRTGIYLPEAGALVQQRYGFVHAPKVPEASQQVTSFRFETGVLKKAEKTYSLSVFEVHPHGLVVEGTDTETGETFLEDFLEFGIDNLGMKRPTREPNKIFYSAVVVEFGSNFNRVLKKWEAVSDLFSASLKSTYQITARAQIGSVRLRADPQDMTPRQSVLVNEFALERRIYEPYEHNRIFAAAPLRTDEHIALLHKFEKMFLDEDE